MNRTIVQIVKCELEFDQIAFALRFRSSGHSDEWSNFRCWHLADMTAVLTDVCSWSRSGPCAPQIRCRRMTHNGRLARGAWGLRQGYTAGAGGTTGRFR